MNFEFSMEADRTVTLLGLSDLFDAINKVLNVCRTVSAYPSSGGAPFANAVASLQMHSPLKVKVQLFSIPKDAVDAALKFFTNIIFYRHENSRRAALAAREWEDVYAKRLANIRVAVRDRLAAATEHRANAD